MYEGQGAMMYIDISPQYAIINLDYGKALQIYAKSYLKVPFITQALTSPSKIFFRTSQYSVSLLVALFPVGLCLYAHVSSIGSPRCIPLVGTLIIAEHIVGTITSHSDIQYIESLWTKIRHCVIRPTI